MIHNENNLILICDLWIFQFIMVHINSQMCCTIITHHAIKCNSMYIVWFYKINTGSAGDNLFS